MAALRASLRAKLVASFLLVALIGIAGSSIGIIALSATGKIAKRQYERVTLPAARLARVSVVFQRMATGVRDVIIADNEADLVRANTFMEAQKGDMEGACSDYLGSVITEEAKARFADFQGKLAAYAASIDELMAKVESGERAGIMSALKGLKGKAVGLQVAIDGLQSDMDGYAAAQAKAAAASLGGAVLAFAAFAFLSLALSGALGIVMARSVVRPLGSMGKLAASIADGDLTGRLGGTGLGRRDEIGTLASSIGGMKEGILGNIAHIREATVCLDEMSRTLERNSGLASEAAEAIVGNVAAAKARVLDQSSGVTETSATIEQILKGIAALDRQIEDQAGGVARSSAAVEQMVANIRAVTNSVEALGSSFAELASASDAGNRMLSDMSSRIASISSQSERLDEANGVVSNIATQTNLLAMNAAIEAAHAGSAGKGFAVVADEIRKLAESASVESKEISRDIAEIKGTIGAMVPSSVETSRAFAEILRLISVLGSREEEIKRAMVEQSSGSKEVLEAIERIESAATSIRGGSAEIREGSKSIAAEMRELLGGSAALGRAMEEIELSSTSVEGVSGDVRVIASGVSAQVSNLAALVGRYRLPETAGACS
jgi:methyl-accepting chemotaxis protein